MLKAGKLIVVGRCNYSDNRNVLGDLRNKVY